MEFYPKAHGWIGQEMQCGELKEELLQKLGDFVKPEKISIIIISIFISVFTNPKLGEERVNPSAIVVLGHRPAFTTETHKGRKLGRKEEKHTQTLSLRNNTSFVSFPLVHPLYLYNSAHFPSLLNKELGIEDFYL